MHESGENYLETILILNQKFGFVRSVDIANDMGFSKPSVSRALGILKNNGYIIIGERGKVDLTEKGLKKAEQIYERHKIITKFLSERLKVEPKTAEADACRMEHIISDETFRKIKQALKNENIGNT